MGARDCTRASSDPRAQPGDATARFNGGARLYARKRPCGRVGTPPERCFNGGARLYARKRETVVLEAALGTRLQWGRAILRAQAYRERAQRARTRTRFNGGARLYARKLAAVHYALIPVILLQWGRAIVRAQAWVMFTDRHAAHLLQWGRAIVRAQADALALAVADDIMLQWGRAIVRAQAERHAERGERGDGASMGARDCTRASSSPTSPPTSSSPCFNGGARLYARKHRPRVGLQVGEGASMGARDCTRASLTVARSLMYAGRASMGARDCTRASVTSLRRCCDARGCFNGGARLYARKPPITRSPSRATSGFNGGARLYARKHDLLTLTVTYPIELQWGRAIVRAQAEGPR